MSIRAVMAAAVVMIGLAAPVHADPTGPDSSDTDATFVAALRQVGITFPRDDLVIAAGKYACNVMDEGKSGADVVNSVMEKNPGLANARAEKFVAVAATVYCPHHIVSGGDVPGSGNGGN